MVLGGGDPDVQVTVTTQISLEAYAYLESCVEDFGMDSVGEAAAATIEIMALLRSMVGYEVVRDRMKAKRKS